LKKSDAEYADIRIEDATSSWINFRGKELDSIGSSKSLGGIVRALVKGGWGYATFNDLSNLGNRVKEACESARMVGKEETQFAQVEPVVDVMKATLEKNFREISLSDKKSAVEEYNEIALGHNNKIQTTRSGMAIISGRYVSQVPKALILRTKDQTHFSMSTPPQGKATTFRTALSP